MQPDNPNLVIEISDLALVPEKPVVSVLMITYNHEKYIAQAVQGIVSQITDFPFELVIGEDCSQDGTRVKALELQKDYPHIVRVLYSERNIGANKNFQRVLSACKGDFIAVCEGDDYWNDVRKLQKQIDFLSRHPEYVVSYHDAHVVSENGEPVRKSVFYELTHDFSADELMLGSYVPMFTMCFRNIIRELPEEFFRVVNGDTFLTSLLGNHGHAKYQSDIDPSAYRLHAGGIWSGMRDEDKAIQSITTYYWLSMYYKRQRRDAIAKKFAITAMGIMNNMTPNPGYFPFSWTMARLFTRQYKTYRRAKNHLRSWFASQHHHTA